MIRGRKAPPPLAVVGTWCLMFLLALALWHFAPDRRTSQGSTGSASGQEFLEQLQALSRNLSLPAESPLLTLVDAPVLRGDESQRGLLNFPAAGPLDGFVDRPLLAMAGATSPGGDLADPSSGASDEALDSHATETAACNDVHPNADSPDMVHVVYACDTSQVEGVQASVASAVAVAASPDELTVHIMVQEKWVREFKERFGLRPECKGTVTEGGVLIQVHAINAQLIERSVAKVPSAVRKERGGIDAVENFARFYMHLILDRAVVIYLDADTIVQADLGKLRKDLVASNKTVGFVARDKPVKLDKFLKKPTGCNTRLKEWKRLMSMPAYNVGVFAVNLQRWKEQRVIERVEGLVADHNRCGGKLWVGGSQPPLLLAFLDKPNGAADDYMVFDAAWNTGDLGWRTNLKENYLKTKFILHWNGKRKPWKPNGLYKPLWLPHRTRFDALMKPYDSAGEGDKEGGAASVGAASPVGTTTLSPEELRAREHCPWVQLLDDWGDRGAEPCTIGRTYGCAPDGAGMWTSAGCAGLFNVSGEVTVCGLPSQGPEGTPCAAGAMPPRGNCGPMLLTSFFTTKKDWQRGKFAKANFQKIQKLYQTAITQGAEVTVIYDSLPDDLLKYQCDRFHFVQVDLNSFDQRYGLNDVRYFFFEQLLNANPNWGTIFIVDAFDVRVGKSPCTDMRPGVVYVGSEQDRLRRHPWMKARFGKMGGKYNQWYLRSVSTKQKILNCGITGGQRAPMLELIRRMREVLTDPDISIMQKKEDINLNMAALNYIVYVEFDGRFVTGAPVHSVYKRFEKRRKDVWFIHK